MSPSRSASSAARPDIGHWPDERARLPSRFTAVAVAVLLGFIGLMSLVCLGATAGIAVAAVRDPGILTNPDPNALLSSEFMFASFFVGFGGFAAFGTALTFAVGWRPRHALALRGSPILPFLVAILGGLVVGLFPGWIAQQLMEAFPDLANRGALEMISRLMTSGSWVSRGLLISTVVIGAPLFEEICFRGLLWNALERIAPGVWGQLLALVFTSLAFLLAHADLVQSPALFATAFFLGWLRLTSGSLIPCIIAHFLNNLLATVLTIAFADVSETFDTPLWLAAVGLGLTLFLALVALLGRRRPLATPEAAWAARRRS